MKKRGIERKIPADVNIIVCTDIWGCVDQQVYGCNGPALLKELRSAVNEHGLESRVQVTPCNCIFGCTYGPRVDVARRWSGEKILYGTAEGQVTISVRGTVSMSRFPQELLDLALDNLPDTPSEVSPKNKEEGPCRQPR